MWYWLALKKQIFWHLKFILRTETFACFFILYYFGSWRVVTLIYFFSSSHGCKSFNKIREAMDFLVVCAVALSCWKCPYCLSFTLCLAHMLVSFHTLRNWVIHCAVISHHISAFILFNCMRICWLHLCTFCVLTH